MPGFNTVKAFMRYSIVYSTDPDNKEFLLRTSNNVLIPSTQLVLIAGTVTSVDDMNCGKKAEVKIEPITGMSFCELQRYKMKKSTLTEEDIRKCETVQMNEDDFATVKAAQDFLKKSERELFIGFTPVGRFLSGAQHIKNTLVRDETLANKKPPARFTTVKKKSEYLPYVAIIVLL